jgi:predicted AlkP superfamily pyrophosphatase or phosphodiesterase
MTDPSKCPLCRQVLCFLVLACAMVCGSATAGARSGKPFVMLISIDGLKPEAILEAASHGLEVRNLRAFLADGVYSTGVHGVLPTLTYPSHMTILTGASPARHGIYSNTTFDPLKRNDYGWYCWMGWSPAAGTSCRRTHSRS